MSHWPIAEVHISTIRPGDVVIYHGQEVTVGVKDVRRDAFWGTLLFGDPHRLGLQPVKKVLIERAMPKVTTE